MSSIPSRLMDEDFVRDFYAGPELTDEQVALILKTWEPFRESVEITLDMFEEEEQSWRDYRNSHFDYLPNPLRQGG